MTPDDKFQELFLHLNVSMLPVYYHSKVSKAS